MCTTQPVYQVTVDNLLTYFCGRCIAEHSSNSTVVLQNKKPVVGQMCQCKKCK